MMSKTEFCVIHLFPYSAKWAGGHSNATIAFMKAQILQGIEVEGLSPFAPSIPSEQWSSLEGLPIQELDFNTSNLGQRTLELAVGCSRPIFTCKCSGKERRLAPLHELRSPVRLQSAAPLAEAARGPDHESAPDCGALLVRTAV
jgi:hypothetical protein